MLTKTMMALAITVASVSGALAAGKTHKHVRHTHNPATAHAMATTPKAQAQRRSSNGYTCSADGQYCGDADYWEGFRDTGDRD
jgi:hypothetical protein